MQGKNKLRVVLLITLPLLVGGATWMLTRSLSSSHAREAHADDPYTRSRRIGGIVYTMRYLPPQELVKRELASLTAPSPALRDSIAKAYEGTATFRMTIEGHADSATSADVLVATSRDQGEYAARLSALSFDMEGKIFVKTNHGDIHPLLTHFEPISGKANESCLMIVFPRGEEGAALRKNDICDIVFVDQMFGTGIQHFLFDSSLM